MQAYLSLWLCSDGHLFRFLRVNPRLWPHGGTVSSAPWFCLQPLLRAADAGGPTAGCGSLPRPGRVFSRESTSTHRVLLDPAPPPPLGPTPLCSPGRLTPRLLSFYRFLFSFPSRGFLAAIRIWRGSVTRGERGKFSSWCPWHVRIQFVVEVCGNGKTSVASRREEFLLPVRVLHTSGSGSVSCLARRYTQTQHAFMRSTAQVIVAVHLQNSKSRCVY